MGVPEPHNVTAVWPFSLASWNFLIIAGSTCEVCRSKLSKGPYRLVGIKLTKFLSNCFLMASQALTPDILARAYHSLVGSNGAVSRHSSFNGCGASFGYMQELPKKTNVSQSNRWAES